jgi:hypothetical protein
MQNPYFSCLEQANRTNDRWNKIMSNKWSSLLCHKRNVFMLAHIIKHGLGNAGWKSSFIIVELGESVIYQPEMCHRDVLGIITVYFLARLRKVIDRELDLIWAQDLRSKAEMAQQGLCRCHPSLSMMSGQICVRTVQLRTLQQAS